MGQYRVRVSKDIFDLLRSESMSIGISTERLLEDVVQRALQGAFRPRPHVSAPSISPDDLSVKLGDLDRVGAEA